MKWINFVVALAVIGAFDWLVLQGIMFFSRKAKALFLRARSGGK